MFRSNDAMIRLYWTYFKPNWSDFVRCVSLLSRFCVFSIGRRCNQPMGLQSGRLNNRLISASSQWDNYHAAFLARLNWNRRGRYMGAWSAKHNNRYQWLQINFGRAAKIIRIATQGRADADQWVTQYYVMHSLDGIRFEEYKERNSRRVGIS